MTTKPKPLCFNMYFELEPFGACRLIYISKTFYFGFKPVFRSTDFILKGGIEEQWLFLHKLAVVYHCFKTDYGLFYMGKLLLNNGGRDSHLKHSSYSGTTHPYSTVRVFLGLFVFCILSKSTGLT